MKQRSEKITSSVRGFSSAISPNTRNEPSACERYTPSAIITLVRKVMPIHLDPASCEAANAIVKAKRFFSEQDDGLSKLWHGNVWLNPPYDERSKRFLQKLMEEMRDGRVPQAIALFQCKMLQSISTNWFQPLLAGTFCVPFTRPKFWYQGKEYGSPATGTLLWYGGPNSEKFEKVFASYGMILRGLQGGLPPKTARDERHVCTCRPLPRSRDVRWAELGLLLPTQSL